MHAVPTMPGGLPGPGLGMSATRLADRLRTVGEIPTGVPTPGGGVGHQGAYAYREWGDGSRSPLYCPLTERVNEPLEVEVDRRLVEWAAECGFTDEECAALGRTGFGRLCVLTHPDTDDPERVLIAARMNTAWWAADDLYADDSSLGAVPGELPSKLALAMAAMDPVPPVGGLNRDLEQALESQRVLVALRSATRRMGGYASPAQAQRVCYSTFAMFVSWNAYAAWRHTDQYPSAWEYVAARQHDSFYTSMTLIDIVSGYELTANLFYEPRVREALIQAGTATVLANDLFSVRKDSRDAMPPPNTVLCLARDRDCSVEEATELTIDLHNQLVQDFEANHRRLQAVPSPELWRFLRGARAWMGGSFEWHNTNPRYR